MSDFAQTGLISTFQQLNEAHLPRIEEELTELAAIRPITLVLPCYGDDLQKPALAHIIRELEGATFLREVIVSLNGVEAQGLAAARQLFARLPQQVRMLWNDGPSLREVWTKALGSQSDFAGGKGFNIWAAFGVVCAEQKSVIVVTQDCDVASFRRATLARLSYACAHPQLDYSLAKMYYGRVTDRLYGRVSRLFLTPLLHTMVRIGGHHPLIDFLLSFRYALAGECAVTRELAGSVDVSSNWGVEIGLLCSVFRHADPRTVCQVDGGSGYDHKHHSKLSALVSMSDQIARAMLAHAAAEGIRVDEASLADVAATYRREAFLAVRRSEHLALINGLPFDSEEELATVKAFASQLEGRDRAMPLVLPAWNKVFETQPGLGKELLATVDREG